MVESVKRSVLYTDIIQANTDFLSMVDFDDVKRKSENWNFKTTLRVCLIQQIEFMMNCLKDKQ